MSHNLTLCIGPAEVGLYQTTTEVTMRARAGGYVDAKAIYFASLGQASQRELNGAPDVD